MAPLGAPSPPRLHSLLPRPWSFNAFLQLHVVLVWCSWCRGLLEDDAIAPPPPVTRWCAPGRKRRRGPAGSGNKMAAPGEARAARGRVALWG